MAQRVFFLGRHPDPENFLAGLDIFALPSKTEGVSNALIEAMASGLPVVCADLPCHHEVFHADGEGEVVSPCTAVTLAASLAELSCRGLSGGLWGQQLARKCLPASV